jgi:signal transduction histidine kinase
MYTLNQTDPAAAAFCGTPTFLYQLVNRLQECLQHQAVDKQSVIVNDVDKTVSISADEDILAFIIGGFISNTVHNTSHCCIRVDTVRCARGIQVRMRNNGVFLSNGCRHSLANMINAARRLGGYISVESEDARGTTVLLTMATDAAA